ncbi:MAG: DNA polymerase III subunit delta [Burkholderiaceae bacterium]
MRLELEQLEPHLQQGGLRSLYTLYGAEPLLLQEAADALRRAAYQAGYGQRQVCTMASANDDWGPVLASHASMSLFGDRQLIEVRIPGGKPGKVGSVALQQLAEQLAGAAAGDTLTLVLLPRLDATQTKSAWMAALEQGGVVVRVNPVVRAALPAWLAKRLAQQGQRVAPGDEGERSLKWLAACVEGNLLAAHQEVQKLAFDPFGLSAAVLAGQAERAERMLQGLQAEGVSPVLVHFALTEDLRSCAQVCKSLSQGRALPAVLREQRIWGDKERLMGRIAPHLNLAQTLRWLRQAHEVDGVIKGLRLPAWPAQPWLALRQLARQVAQGCCT